MKRTSAFTLVEVLIVVIVLGILAAAIIPAFSEASDDARASTSATLVRSLTRLNETIRMKTGSYPTDFTADMFEGRELPASPFDPDAATLFQIVDNANLIHPGTKTVSNEGAFWYNKANGIVRIRVTAGANNQETLALYNAANGCNATKIGQTKQNK